MQITVDLEHKNKVLKKIAEREFYERSGTHNSDLIFCLNRQALRKLYPVEPTEHELLLYSLGWASQRWLTGQDKDIPEIIVDGIVVTLDALDDGCPWELKATFQSSSKSIDDSLHWVRQLMSQCYVSKSLIAHFTRFEIMGNWKWVWHIGRPPKPESLEKYISEFGENWDAHPTLGAFKIEFTQEELDRHWAWMKQRKELFEKLVASGAKELLPKAIAVGSGMEWLCDWCAYKPKECYDD